MIKWKTITIDKDGTFHKFKYTTDDVHINRKLGTGNNKSAWLNRMKKDQRELIKVDEKLSKLEKKNPGIDPETGLPAIFSKRYDDYRNDIEYYTELARIKRDKIKAIKRHLNITTPDDDDEREWSTLGNNAGEEEMYRKLVGTKPLPSWEWEVLEQKEKGWVDAYKSLMRKRNSKGQRKIVKVKRRSPQNVPAEVEAAEKAHLDESYDELAIPGWEDFFEEGAVRDTIAAAASPSAAAPQSVKKDTSSDEDVELRQLSTDSLGGRKKKTRKSLFKKSLLKKKRTKRKRGYGGKSSKRRKTKKRRAKRGYGGKSPKRRKRKQKGGARTPGNWLKISEIQAADVCVYCGQTLMNPRTPEKTAYMMSCCVDEVTGEGFLAHTGCIHEKCENDEVNCPMCDDSIYEACLDIETYYNPEPDILVPAPITLNEGLEYYNPELLSYEVRQEAMPGGGSRKFLL